MLKSKSPELLVFIASVLFGFPAILTKMLIGVLSPIAVLTFRFLFLIISFPFIVCMLKRSSLSDLFSISKTEFKHFFFLSLFLVADMALFFQSFYYIEVSTALFLFLNYPVMLLLMARFFLKEKITATDIAATSISLIGIVLVFWSKLNLQDYSILGDLMVLSAALLWAGYIVMNRYSANGNHYRKTFWIFLLNSAMFLPLLILFGNPVGFTNIKIYHFLILTVLSVVSTLIPYTLLSYTADRVKSSTSSIILLFGPIIGVILSFVVLKEEVPFNVIAGGFLIVISAFISTFSIEKLLQASKYFARKIRTILFGYNF
ncbi:MAG: DMT family transporter [Nanoarchaeota archaeon]